MDNHNRLKSLPIISLLLSAIFPFLLINSSGFPFLGFSLFFITGAVLLFIFKKQRSAYDTLLFLCILILSVFLVLRSNFELVFLNLSAIVYLSAVFMLHENVRDRILLLLTSPFIALKKILESNNAFSYDFQKFTKNSDEKYREHIPAIILTLILLIIILPLLSYANPFFNQLIQNILTFFNLNSLLAESYLYIIRLCFFFLLLLFIPRFLYALRHDDVQIPELKTYKINYLIPKAVLSIVLFIFFITQIQLYMASSDTLRQLGYTNSQLTNEVFTQLSIVAFIIFLLIYNDPGRSKWRTLLTYILVIETVFLTGIAFKSDYDYITAYGFTHKRLYGYAVIAWLTGAVLLFLLHFRRNSSGRIFIKQLVLLSSLILIVINTANFDYLIFHYRKTTLPWGVDHAYLSGLSPDSRSYNTHITELVDEIRTLKQAEYPKLSPVYNVLRHIEYLQKKYKSTPPVGTWHYGEWLEYNDVKDIDAAAYRRLLNEKMIRITPPVTPASSPSAQLED